VTGTNRGLGQSRVEEALKRGAQRVYAGTCRPFGVEAGEEDIFPDAMSKTMAESRRTGAAKQLERQNAALIEAQTLAA
jgi:NAD(P)-dependent dehydrogenase (short-subunit alcohol dehydrogenase family)